MGGNKQQFHFNPTHSHRWAEHVHAWLSHILSNPHKKGVHEVAYERKQLPTDNFGTHYTPLMTALMYGLSMDQKMQIEVEALKEILPHEDDLDKRIDKDAVSLMRLFIEDAHTLLDDRNDILDDIVNKIQEGDYKELSFNRESDPDEWKSILTMKPTEENIDKVIKNYVRSRLAQEFWTLQGAVMTYHLITRGPGKTDVKEAIYQNAEAIAWRISAKLIEIMDSAPAIDKKGMRTDHHITDSRTIRSLVDMLVQWEEVNRTFHNCPIFESYQVVERELSEQYGMKAGFDKGEMYFCEVCKHHGDQAAQLFMPWIFKLGDYNRSDIGLFNGGKACNFSYTVKLPSLTGRSRVRDARYQTANPPALTPMLKEHKKVK